MLFRECLDSPGCQPLYIDALRQIAANHTVAGLADKAHTIEAAMEPWRAHDTRAEQSVADGEAQANAKFVFMAARPAQLRQWFGISSTGPESLAPTSSVRPILGSRSPYR